MVNSTIVKNPERPWGTSNRPLPAGGCAKILLNFGEFTDNFLIY